MHQSRESGTANENPTRGPEGCVWTKHRGEKSTVPYGDTVTSRRTLLVIPFGLRSENHRGVPDGSGIQVSYLLGANKGPLANSI